VGAAALGLPSVWRDVPAKPCPVRATMPGTRFYLFALKGLAYLSLRLGDEGEARDALALLRALDPDDRVGGALIEAVRLRAEARDQMSVDADLDTRTPATCCPPGPLAWASLRPPRRCAGRGLQCSDRITMATRPAADQRHPAQDWQGQAITDATAPLRPRRTAPPRQAPLPAGPQLRARRVRAAHRPLLPPPPGLAGGNLAHPYFEVRAIAARHADLFSLTRC
jgi:hypothetical protein